MHEWWRERKQQDRVNANSIHEVPEPHHLNSANTSKAFEDGACGNAWLARCFAFSGLISNGAGTASKTKAAQNTETGQVASFSPFVDCTSAFTSSPDPVWLVRPHGPTLPNTLFPSSSSVVSFPEHTTPLRPHHIVDPQVPVVFTRLVPGPMERISPRSSA